MAAFPRPAAAGEAQVRRGRSAGTARSRSPGPAMAYRELVRRWHEAVRAADRGHWDAALDAFGGIAEPPARICFNVGCVQLLAGRPEAALRVSEPGGKGGEPGDGRLGSPRSVSEGMMLKLDLKFGVLCPACPAGMRAGMLEGEWFEEKV